MLDEDNEFADRPNFVRMSMVALCVCFGVAALIIAGSINYIAYAVPEAIHTEMIQTRTTLQDEFEATRGDLNAQLNDARKQVLSLADNHLKTIEKVHLTNIEADLNYKLDKTEEDFNARLNDTNKIINYALYQYDQTALAVSGQALSQIAPITNNLALWTAKLANQGDQQQPPLLVLPDSPDDTQQDDSTILTLGGSSR